MRGAGWGRCWVGGKGEFRLWYGWASVLWPDKSLKRDKGIEYEGMEWDETRCESADI